MKSYDTEPLEWTAEMEIDLFYSMVDHKPVGENKHFHMLFIYEKYNNLNERKLTVAQLWHHLSELYDLNSLVIFPLLCILRGYYFNLIAIFLLS